MHVGYDWFVMQLWTWQLVSSFVIHVKKEAENENENEKEKEKEKIKKKQKKKKAPLMHPLWLTSSFAMAWHGCMSVLYHDIVSLHITSQRECITNAQGAIPARLLLLQSNKNVRQHCGLTRIISDMSILSISMPQGHQ